MVTVTSAAAVASVRAFLVVVRRSGSVPALSRTKVQSLKTTAPLYHSTVVPYSSRLARSHAPSWRRPNGTCIIRSLSSSSGVPAERLTSSDGVVATHPIDFDVASKIEGNESQICTIALEPGQVLRSVMCLSNFDFA